MLKKITELIKAIKLFCSCKCTCILGDPNIEKKFVKISYL